MNLSENHKQVLVMLIWCLSPADRSIFQGVLDRLSKKNDACIGTTEDSANFIFYSMLEKFGLAYTKSLLTTEPSIEGRGGLDDVIKIFSLHPEAIFVLSQAINVVVAANEEQPKNSIVSPEAIQILKRYEEKKDPQAQSKLVKLCVDRIGEILGENGFISDPEITWRTHIFGKESISPKEGFLLFLLHCWSLGLFGTMLYAGYCFNLSLLFFCAFLLLGTVPFLSNRILTGRFIPSKFIKDKGGD